MPKLVRPAWCQWDQKFSDGRCTNSFQRFLSPTSNQYSQRHQFNREKNITNQRTHPELPQHPMCLAYRIYWAIPWIRYHEPLCEVL